MYIDQKLELGNKTGNEAAIHLQKILTAVVVQWNVVLLSVALSVSV